MSKPKKLGMKSTYIPNSKADMRWNKKLYQHNIFLNAKGMKRAKEGL